MPSRFDKETRAKAVRLVRDHVADYEVEETAPRAPQATESPWNLTSFVTTGSAGCPTESGCQRPGGRFGGPG